MRVHLAPGIWLPLVGVLAAAVVVLAILLVVNGGRDAPVTVVCEPGTPGCELRQPVHWHADFALYVRGVRYDFNQERFYSGVEDELSDTVHLHKPFSTVVHVHREGATWREFFTSLGFQLSDRCLTTPEGEAYCNSDRERLSFVLNGVKLDGIAFMDITDIDRVLISFGRETDEELLAQYQLVTDKACILSQLCMERVPPGGLPDEACSKDGCP